MVKSYPISEIQCGDTIEAPKGLVGKVIKLIPTFGGEFKVKIEWFHDGSVEWFHTSDLEYYEILR